MHATISAHDDAEVKALGEAHMGISRCGGYCFVLNRRASDALLAAAARREHNMAQSIKGFSGNGYVATQGGITL